VFGPSSSPVTPSAAPTYNYLPVVSGQVPFDSTTSALSAHLVSSSMAANSSSITADHRHTGSPAVQDLAPLDSDRRSAICPMLSHACFEVWIAMELCDGGTLAEQLQRGFHCHPGSEQVDMVSTPGSSGTLHALCMWLCWPVRSCGPWAVASSHRTQQPG
jgi:hypothetical protein